MATSYSRRVKTAVITLVVFVSLVNVITQVKNNYRSSSVDPITQGANRFAPLKKVIPRLSVIGYVNELQAAQHDEKSEFGRYLAQYELAPIIIDRGALHQFVIGDFSDPGKSSSFASEMHLKPMEEFEDGLVLFGQKDP